jgi:hypothetical protein
MRWSEHEKQTFRNNMQRYIICANGNKAIAVHSDLNWMEFTDYVRENSKPIHEDGTDRLFKIGMMEFVNPEVMSPNDFGNYCPYLIGIK